MNQHPFSMDGQRHPSEASSQNNDSKDNDNKQQAETDQSTNNLETKDYSIDLISHGEVWLSVISLPMCLFEYLLHELVLSVDDSIRLDSSSERSSHQKITRNSSSESDDGQGSFVDFELSSHDPEEAEPEMSEVWIEEFIATL